MYNSNVSPFAPLRLLIRFLTRVFPLLSFYSGFNVVFIHKRAHTIANSNFVFPFALVYSKSFLFKFVIHVDALCPFAYKMCITAPFLFFFSLALLATDLYENKAITNSLPCVFSRVRGTLTHIRYSFPLDLHLLQIAG